MRSGRTLFLVAPGRTELREVAVPTPAAGEVLVRIEAATTCGTDVKVFLRGGHPRMLEVPAPFGHEMAGVIAKCGRGVAGWREGDAVIIANSASCGECRHCRRGRENLCERLEYLNGAYSDFILVPARFVERSLHRKPAGLPFELAAMAEPLACVVHGAEVLGLSRPSEVLVIGCGPIGLLFVALLASLGHRVTAADRNASRLEAATSLGASAARPLSRASAKASSGRDLSADLFEAVVEATGAPEAWSMALEVVATGGDVLLFGGCAPGTSVDIDTHRLHYSELTVRGAYHHRPDTFRKAIDLLEGQLSAARLLVSEQVPLEGAEDALRRMIERKILKAAVRPGG